MAMNILSVVIQPVRAHRRTGTRGGLPRLAPRASRRGMAASSGVPSAVSGTGQRQASAPGHATDRAARPAIGPPAAGPQLPPSL
jgi:hypothetical protein